MDCRAGEKEQKDEFPAFLLLCMQQTVRKNLLLVFGRY